MSLGRAQLREGATPPAGTAHTLHLALPPARLLPARIVAPTAASKQANEYARECTGVWRRGSSGLLETRASVEYRQPGERQHRGRAVGSQTLQCEEFAAMLLWAMDQSSVAASGLHPQRTPFPPVSGTRQRRDQPFGGTSGSTSKDVSADTDVHSTSKPGTCTPRNA